jgi:hypothetical protein
MPQAVKPSTIAQLEATNQAVSPSGPQQQHDLTSNSFDLQLGIDKSQTPIVSLLFQFAAWPNLFSHEQL